jgi:hypothetical protein
MHGLHSGFFSTLTPACYARCMGTCCLHVTQSETYAEVRNLGVKLEAQGGVEWYVTGYTRHRIYKYILVYSMIYKYT